MTTFGRVLPELLRTCAEDVDSRDGIARYAVIRDVRGRVRLVVEPNEGATVSLPKLEAALSAALGDYFVPPILSAARGGEVQRLAKTLLDQTAGKWPNGWPRSFRDLLGAKETGIDVGVRWTGIDRTIGKEAWLTSSPPAPPWPLVKGKTPPIITFHSFKGGVGRTTLVSAFAIQLVSGAKPKRVAVVDLDLEAPGVGLLLNASSERGVIDVLVDHIATGRIDLADASTSAQIGGPADENIRVFAAGAVDEGYVQKLARLDYSSTEPGKENPVQAALGAMLHEMRKEFDVILLDARAGLHDLAGMSLHGLAHVDVLVFRGTQQNLTGLEQTLRTLGSRDATNLVLVETLLPATDEELFRIRRDRTRARVYELLLEFVYEEEDPPQPADVDVPHDVVHVRRREWLDGLDSMKDHVEDVLRESDLGEVARRVRDAAMLSEDGDVGDDLMEVSHDSAKIVD